MATGKSSLDFGSVWFPVDLIDDPLNVLKRLNGWQGRLEALSCSQGNAKSSSIRRLVRMARDDDTGRRCYVSVRWTVAMVTFYLRQRSTSPLLTERDMFQN